jgi:hypothetical protein
VADRYDARSITSNPPKVDVRREMIKRRYRHQGVGAGDVMSAPRFKADVGRGLYPGRAWFSDVASAAISGAELDERLNKWI